LIAILYSSHRAKHKVEQILKQAGLPTTMLRASFMEEFWKQYTRPSVQRVFSLAVQPNKPLHLITTKIWDVAAHVMKHRSQYVGQEIELAGDVLTPNK